MPDINNFKGRRVLDFKVRLAGPCSKAEPLSSQHPGSRGEKERLWGQTDPSDTSIRWLTSSKRSLLLPFSSLLSNTSEVWLYPQIHSQRRSQPSLPSLLAMMTTCWGIKLLMFEPWVGDTSYTNFSICVPWEPFSPSMWYHMLPPG